MEQPHYWKDALSHLAKDAPMCKLIEAFPKLTLTSRDNAFETLIRSIVGQQISVSAADAIWQRINTALISMTPKQLINTPFDTLKQCGLSKQKTQYLYNIAQHFEQQNITANYFANRSFDDIQKELITIKGIGNWTIEMFAIFYLNEPDIFPIKDLGLTKAIKNLYQLEATPDKQQLMQLSHRWRPYRTVATWYLWRSIDAEVVQY